MFIDTSALVAILTTEEDAADIDLRLCNAKSRWTSPLVMLEATMVLSSQWRVEPEAVLQTVTVFLTEANVSIVSIDAGDGYTAVEAFARYGKGRHPAKLNLADCLSYACAKNRDLPLLYKGDDFARTDLAYATP